MRKGKVSICSCTDIVLSSARLGCADVHSVSMSSQNVNKAGFMQMNSYQPRTAFTLNYNIVRHLLGEFYWVIYENNKDDIYFCFKVVKAV